MKVLYIIDSLTSGGKERRLVSLIESMTKFDDIQMELIILSKVVHYESIFKTGIRIHHLKRDIRKDFFIVLKFNKILKDFKPDVVHCWDNLAAINFAPLCKLKGIPFLNSMITSAPTLIKYGKRHISNALSYPFSDVILSNSQAGLNSFYVPKRKQKVIYNGFDFKRIKKLRDKEEVFDEFNIIQGRPVVGMVAAFSDKKDFLTLLKAAKILDEKITVVLVGHGANLQSMKEYTTENSIKNIYFLGKQQDVESIVNIFDMGVLLSTDGEGISNSVMEYMVLKKPVIVTSGGGTVELVNNGVSGFIISPFNTEELVDKISLLINDQELSKKMGKEGYDRIKNNFNIDKMVEQFYNLYKHYN